MENILLNKIDYLLEEYESQEINESMRKGLDNLEKSKLTLEESYVEGEKLDEAAISVTLIISVLLAMPSVIETIANSIGFLYKKIKKLFGAKEESKAIEKIVELAEKWHHGYVATLRQILRIGGVFKSAGIEDKEKQEKATEVVFYTIIFGFAVYGGIATGKSILHMVKHMDLSHINMASLEGVLTAIKSREVQSFIKKVV